MFRKNSVTHNSDAPEVAILDSELYGINIYARWLKDLYGQSETVDILNKTASAFFYELKEIIIDATIIRVCRLVNDDDSGSLTIKSILKRLPECSNKEFATVELSRLRSSIANWVKHRNKRIAHLDKSVAFESLSDCDELGTQAIEDNESRSGDPVRLTGISASEFFRIIDELGLVMKYVYLSFGDTWHDYRAMEVPGGAADLLIALREVNCHRTTFAKVEKNSAQ